MVLAVLFALRCGAAEADPATLQLPPGFADHVVLTGLDHPVGFAFLPDGRALVAEQKSGAIRLVVGGTLAPTPVGMVNNLNFNGQERGLLAIAVDPAWPVRPYVYVHGTMQSSVMQLVRYTATGALTDPTSFNIALGSPYVVLDGLADLQLEHNGGALRFGTDGKLFYSLGEDGDMCQAQDSTTLHGALLRIDVSQLPAGSGGPPARTALVCPDNPWAGGASVNARLVWAYGLRNPFRFVIDPADGSPFVSDVGDNTWEELDHVFPGFNGGWPFREGPALHSGGSSCSEPGGAGKGAYDGPIASYDHNDGVVIIAAGVIRYRFGSAWPLAWNGNVLFADYYSGFLRMVGLVGSVWQPVQVPGQPDTTDFATGLIASSDFAWGPNGDLYWLQQDDGLGSPLTGVLHRIHAGEPTAVSTPAAARTLALRVSPNPATGAVTMHVTLPAGGWARLTVLDLAGREMARPFAGRPPGGAFEIPWNGLDAAGHRAPAGVYLARLESDAGSSTTRFVHLR